MAAPLVPCCYFGQDDDCAGDASTRLRGIFPSGHYENIEDYCDYCYLKNQPEIEAWKEQFTRDEPGFHWEEIPIFDVDPDGGEESSSE